MALFSCSRIASNPVLASLSRFSASINTARYAQSAIPKIIYKKYEAEKDVHQDIRNAQLKRPMSPHLTIYRYQLTSMLSITHRITGLALSGYASALGLGALCLPNDISNYITMIEGLHLSPATLFLAKVVIAYPLGYHFANGIRHLYWDTARGLSIKEVYATGYAMLAASVVITLILAAL